MSADQRQTPRSLRRTLDHQEPKGLALEPVSVSQPREVTSYSPIALPPLQAPSSF